MAGAALAIATSFAPAAGAASGTVNLVAYSTPSAAYTAIAKAFSETSAGTGITVAGSYGASGTQARNVVAGQAADVVNFSLEPDMETLVKAGIVSPKWDKFGPDHGNVTDSVVVFIVRPGNPKHIRGWSDLVKTGVQVVTPNPFSSGSARWNLAAAYGAQLKLGKSPAQADKYLARLLKNVVSQPPSASTALAAFVAGTGDVLLDYEDDAIAAENKGEPIQYVIPKQDILIENPIAVTTNAQNPTAAKAFVNYLLSKKGQELWAIEGYRPVLAGAAKAAGVTFPTPLQLFTIQSLGGWTKVVDNLFDPTSGAITKIEEQLGQSTASG
ncbi:MAG TPA: sulfate ABC transporter substrate-binding protein [Acidimicrobiales bacterium]|nr:sulfate ABC transporter substrate-binding protein [Acidimicrobiales bacterium]